jgi:uncharacterized membrane protein YfcA
MNALIDPSIRSIQGAWAALRLDDTGYAQIDGSDAGFRRSWAALLLALPFIMLMALAATKAIALSNLAGVAPKLPEIPLPITFVSGIVQWLLSAGCLALIAVVFGKADKIKQLIACDNWITLWFLVLEAPFNVLTATGLLHPVGAIGAALLGVFGLVVGARMLLVVLKLPVAAVIGILVFVLLIQLSLAQLFQGLAS